MLAEVIAIGDELTSGARLDTNSQWLAERLTEMGVRVMFHSTVGDDLDAEAQVFRTAASRANVVIATGGLGPTADDLTREAIAAAAGVDLIRDEASLAHIRQLFESRGRTMPEANARQAEFPVGATPIPNPHGTAPGVRMETDCKGNPPGCVFALPGVPAEMREMWFATVEPAIRALQPSPQVTRHYRLKCFGTGESHLEAMLPDLIRRGREPSVGITVSKATITLRITATAETDAACRLAMQPTIDTICECLGDLVFGEEDEELQHAVAKFLAARGETVATAESWTGGLLAGWLSETEGSGAWLRGSRIDPNLSDIELGHRAALLREESGADYALIAGDVVDDRLSIALATSTDGIVKHYPTAGHPDIIKHRGAKQALNLLRRHLLKTVRDPSQTGTTSG